MTILEKQIEDRLVKWCKARGLQCLKLRIDGVNGFPDRTILGPNGLCIFVELKRTGGVLSAAQKNFLAWASLNGHAAFVAYSFEDAIAWIQAFISSSSGPTIM
jgi:hypothetical protein